MNQKKNFIIITSIFHPTDSVKLFAKKEDWQLVVVGDKKTPPDWQYENVIYLSPQHQESLGFKILEKLPWNHYCRKMIGYLYAINNGAEMIFDSDDDNDPKPTWPSIPKDDEINTLSGNKFVNVYKHFTHEPVWPRGYPLDHILLENKPDESIQDAKIGVWQFLADEDPDVDAIYRLTNNKQIYFEDNPPIALASGTVCPFNSQNTAFTKEIFPLLYLPAFVTFRFTDILRGLIAQPIMWELGYQLGFAPATVIQKRNPHNYLKDFESEVPVYLHSEQVVDIALEALESGPEDLSGKLETTYSALNTHGIVKEEELDLLKAWLEDLKLLQTQ